MTRSIFNLRPVAVICSALLLAGCASNVYRPLADPTQLAATAAKSAYPSSMPSERAPDMFYSTQPNGVVTLYNAGDTSLTSFTVWVAKSYSVIVDKLPAHTMRDIAPESFYNTTGGNLTVVPVANFTPIQINANGHIYDLAGPVHPMPTP